MWIHLNFTTLGTGKSDVIKAVAMHAEGKLRSEGTKPNYPRVLLTAHTGKAAMVIGKFFLYSGISI